jgi:hypothetical protein
VFGFLIKLTLLAGLVAFIWFVAYPKFTHSSTKNPISVISELKNRLASLDYASASQKIGSTLDSLVTHQGTSPIVLGLEITNESLAAIVDALQNLPPDQMNQLKQHICQPATSSAK